MKDTEKLVIIAIMLLVVATILCLRLNRIENQIRKPRTVYISIDDPNLGIITHIDQERLADAIFKAEGEYKAKYLYGIVSVKYKDEANARRICLNTIRNNIVRFEKQDKYTDYIEFLASRYCPVNCDNDNGTNQFWAKNVRYYYEKRSKK